MLKKLEFWAHGQNMFCLKTLCITFNNILKDTHIFDLRKL